MNQSNKKGWRQALALALCLLGALTSCMDQTELIGTWDETGRPLPEGFLENSLTINDDQTAVFTRVFTIQHNEGDRLEKMTLKVETPARWESGLKAVEFTTRWTDIRTELIDWTIGSQPAKEVLPANDYETIKADILKNMLESAQTELRGTSGIYIWTDTKVSDRTLTAKLGEQPITYTRR